MEDYFLKNKQLEDDISYHLPHYDSRIVISNNIRQMQIQLRQFVPV